MKKLFTTIALCFMCAVTVFGQDLIGTFHNSYFDQEYYVKYSEKTTHYYIQIDARTPDRECCFIVNDIENFRKSIDSVKKKYTEWCRVAKENNITDMNKLMNIRFSNGSFAWHGTKWYFNFNAKPKPIFIIDDENYLCLMFAGDEFKASSNEYITEEAYWVFSSVDEIETLEKLLSTETLETYLQNKKNKGNLFK